MPHRMESGKFVRATALVCVHCKANSHTFSTVLVCVCMCAILCDNYTYTVTASRGRFLAICWAIILDESCQIIRHIHATWLDGIGINANESRF